MRSFLLSAVLVASFMASAPQALAQSVPDWAAPVTPSSESAYSASNDMGPLLPDTPEEVPVDGGVLLLGAAGAAYAVRKLRKRRGESAGRDVMVP